MLPSDNERIEEDGRRLPSVLRMVGALVAGGGTLGPLSGVTTDEYLDQLAHTAYRLVLAAERACSGEGVGDAAP